MIEKMMLMEKDFKTDLINVFCIQIKAYIYMKKIEDIKVN